MLIPNKLFFVLIGAGWRIYSGDGGILCAQLGDGANGTDIVSVPEIEMQVVCERWYGDIIAAWDCH